MTHTQLHPVWDSFIRGYHWLQASLLVGYGIRVPKANGLAF